MNGKFDNFQVRGIDGGSTDKREIFEWFNDCSGRRIKKMICNVGMIKEGIDFPHSNRIIIKDPKYSFVDILQNIGRIMRPYGQGNYVKKLCNVTIPMEWSKEERKILEDENAIWTNEMDKKFKKLIRILEVLKTVDGRISEDNLFGRVAFDDEFIG